MAQPGPCCRSGVPPSALPAASLSLACLRRCKPWGANQQKEAFSLSVPSSLSLFLLYFSRFFFLIGKIEKVGKIIEELESSSIAGGGKCKVLQLLWKTVWQLLKKLNIALP